MITFEIVLFLSIFAVCGTIAGICTSIKNEKMFCGTTPSLKTKIFYISAAIFVSVAATCCSIWAWDTMGRSLTPEEKTEIQHLNQNSDYQKCWWLIDTKNLNMNNYRLYKECVNEMNYSKGIKTNQ